MSIDFTVAIPTYNGASRLPKLLEKLRQQTGLDQISWEIIVVDNNSTDNTAQVVQEYQQNWLVDVPLTYILEPQQGAAFARLRAVQEAQGELIGFLDDDNLPNPDWIAQAYTFAQEHPQAGAFSGQIHGDFEVEPPENFQRIQAFLAIREHGSTPHQFEPENLSLPTAAALVVRRKAWQESVPQRPQLKGRLAGSMLGGEDYEPLLYMHKAGWEIWYHPELHTYHQIPHWRLERDYLLSISRGCGLATCQLRMINAAPWQKPIIFIRTFLGNLRRIIGYMIKYRFQVKRDLVVACQWEFFWGSLISSLLYLNSSKNQSAN
jgi:glycosyltransferase involved in cell wall biosynthesis